MRDKRNSGEVPVEGENPGAMFKSSGRDQGVNAGERDAFSARGTVDGGRCPIGFKASGLQHVPLPLILLYAGCHYVRTQSNPVERVDFYNIEYQQFLWDVHILIEGTMHASLRYLDTEAKEELQKIEAEIKRTRNVERLVDEHVDILSRNTDQERFVRNMASVALASRLTHSLRKMARSAESFSHPEKSYGHQRMIEFHRGWIEYEKPFGIDGSAANHDRIEFVETLRQVRNQFVHNGGDANTYKRLDESDLESGEDGYLETDFSRKYPQYVSGDGVGAGVNISESQLQAAIKSSIELVGWLAGELRTRELASIAKINSPQ